MLIIMIVQPAFKNGDQSQAANYRLISLMSICCKLLELFISSFPLHYLKWLESSPSHRHLSSFTPVLPESAWQQPPWPAASSHSPLNSSSL